MLSSDAVSAIKPSCKGCAISARFNSEGVISAILAKENIVLFHVSLQVSAPSLALNHLLAIGFDAV